jgi:hypothetical protein
MVGDRHSGCSEQSPNTIRTRVRARSREGPPRVFLAVRRGRYTPRFLHAFATIRQTDLEKRLSFVPFLTDGNGTWAQGEGADGDDATQASVLMSPELRWAAEGDRMLWAPLKILAK